jgi:osomolarity two-component system response regulator SKN7
MMGSYPESDVARASLAQMNEISRRAEVAGMSFSEPSNISNANSNAGGSRQDTSRVVAAAAADLMSGREKLMTRQDALARIEELQRSRPASAQGSGYVDGNEPFVMDSGTGEGTNSTLQTWNNTAGTTTGASHQGLQVYTLGHLMPKNNADDGNGNWSFDASSLGLPVLGGVGSNGLMGQGQSNEGDANAGYGVPESNNGGPDPTFVDDSSSASGSGAGPSVMPSRPSSSQKLRVRRSTFVPGWAVPPRVLLVDDDAVSRKLSSKFLQVFGCTIDVAVDGVGAVNKMNLEKYDLVLMVRLFAPT